MALLCTANLRNNRAQEGLYCLHMDETRSARNLAMPLSKIYRKLHCQVKESYLHIRLSLDSFLFAWGFLKCIDTRGQGELEFGAGFVAFHCQLFGNLLFAKRWTCSLHQYANKVVNAASICKSFACTLAASVVGHAEKRAAHETQTPKT